MVKKCIYCKTQIDDSSVVDVCRRCGIGVWGEKMFNAIIQNMEGAKEAGNLYQGSVTSSESSSNPKSKRTFSLKEPVESTELNVKNDANESSERIELYTDSELLEEENIARFK